MTKTQLTTPINFSLVVFPDKYDDGIYAAQGVEYNIFAQGESEEKAKESFIRILISHILLDREKGIEPLSRLDPGPEKYRKMFEESKAKGKIELIEPIDLSRYSLVREDEKGEEKRIYEPFSASPVIRKAHVAYA